MHVIREYRTIRKIDGSLVLIENVEGAVYGELAEIELQNGEIRRLEVIEVNGGAVVAQLFGSAAGINPGRSKVRFLGHPPELAVSPDILGRVFDGMGNPADGGPEILAELFIDINGAPVNPAARDFPDASIHTGISAIDGMNTLLRGQALPVFSSPGLPHARLMAQVARQAEISCRAEKLALVFGLVGTPFDETEYFLQEFRRAGIVGRTVVFSAPADRPAMERYFAPRTALTAAEYLAFEKDMDVLVILTDMSNYADALREISASRGEIPGGRGYPVSMHGDLASIYGRAGCRLGYSGSITLMPVLTVPEDDKTHPVADMTRHIADGQIVLSRDLHRKGIFPPVDVAASRSRPALGGAETVPPENVNRLCAAYRSGREVGEFISLFGKGSLDRAGLEYSKFADQFETLYVAQGSDENRSRDETRELTEQLISSLPANKPGATAWEHGEIPSETPDDIEVNGFEHDSEF
jgi:V/A-type H+-transporting ATPase subunit B